jgi:peptide/nickel transport system substrate-binding protein
MTAALLLLLACARDVPVAPTGVLVVLKEAEATWVRNFNPLLNTGAARFPSRCGVYEPLMIHDPLRGRWEPWLATEATWEDSGRALRVVVRPGVTWSDGAPMGADDVVFTFELLAAHDALDMSAVWKRLVSVTAEGDVVWFRLAAPWSPIEADLLHQPIIPRHLWSEVADPLRFTNPEPVGTGPFTEVRRFEGSLFELGRNEGYWQGAPAVEALRFPAIAGNDAANLALVRGELDWAGNFVPAVERIFVGVDPAHRVAWAPLTGGTVMLYPNTTRPPLDDVEVRRALSMALDRATMVDVGMYGYTRPSHPSGLSDSYAGWRDDGLDDVAVVHDPAEAARRLDAAGLRRGPDGWRRLPDGTAWQPTLEAVAGWSDWVRAAQVIVRDLRAVGVDVQLRTRDFGAWFDGLTRGRYDLSIGWSQEGPTPYTFYAALMGGDAWRPVGEAASSGWARHRSVAMDTLLAELAAATDPDAQRDVVRRMQAVFVAELPVLPLFPNPSWGTANSARFTGWPTPEDPYARLSPNHPPEPLRVMTRVRPRQGR